VIYLSVSSLTFCSSSWWKICRATQRRWLLKNSRHIEDAAAISPASLRAAARVPPHVHAERAGQLVEIRAVEERVRQPIDQPQRRVGSRLRESFVEQHALAVRDRVVGQAVHDEKGGAPPLT